MKISIEQEKVDDILERICAGGRAMLCANPGAWSSEGSGEWSRLGVMLGELAETSLDECEKLGRAWIASCPPAVRNGRFAAARAGGMALLLAEAAREEFKRQPGSGWLAPWSARVHTTYESDDEGEIHPSREVIMEGRGKEAGAGADSEVLWEALSELSESLGRSWGERWSAYEIVEEAPNWGVSMSFKGERMEIEAVRVAEAFAESRVLCAAVASAPKRRAPRM